jgi:hypothetical protein
MTTETTARPFRAYAADVAAALGAGWTVEPPDPDRADECAILTSAEGDRLMLRRGWNGRDKLTAWPYWDGLDKHSIRAYDPASGRYIDPTTISINCAASGAPKATAGHIARRLMPDYRAVRAALEERAADHRDYIDRTEAARERLATIAGPLYDARDSTYRRQDTPRATASLWRPGGKMTGSITVKDRGAGASIAIDGLTFDEAAGLLVMLRTLFDADAPQRPA